MANAMGIAKIYDPTGEDKSKNMISDINYFSALNDIWYENIWCVDSLLNCIRLQMKL